MNLFCEMGIRENVCQYVKFWRRAFVSDYATLSLSLLQILKNESNKQKQPLNLVTQATNEHVNEYPGWNHLLFTKNWIGEGRTALLDPQVIHLRLSKLHTQSTHEMENTTE